MPDPDELRDLEHDFSQIAVDLFASGSVAGTLQRIVDLAEQAVEGCDAAGVLTIDADQASTAAASSPLAIELDLLQIGAGEGPCLDAALTATSFYAEDLLGDERWPTFAPLAVAANVRSMLAYSLSAQRPSALNLYSRIPASFGASDRAQGQLFTTLARLALDSAEEQAAGERRAEHLHDALQTRELIGQAQGILMEREHITADAAFDLLRRASQHMNVKLRDVAVLLVETGESPDTGPKRPPDLP